MGDISIKGRSPIINGKQKRPVYDFPEEAAVAGSAKKKAIKKLEPGNLKKGKRS